MATFFAEDQQDPKGLLTALQALDKVSSCFLLYLPACHFRRSLLSCLKLLFTSVKAVWHAGGKHPELIVRF